MICELLSIDKTRPAELKGIKQARINGKPANVMFAGKKGAWKLFIKGNDLFIHATDFFSPSLLDLKRAEYKEIINTTKDLDLKNKLLRVGESDINGLIRHFDLNARERKKFTYSDNWGDVVARQQAWLVFRGIFRFRGDFSSLTQEIAKGIAFITCSDPVDIQMYNNVLVSDIAEAVYKNKLK